MLRRSQTYPPLSFARAARSPWRIWLPSLCSNLEESCLRHMTLFMQILRSIYLMLARHIFSYGRKFRSQTLNFRHYGQMEKAEVRRVKQVREKVGKSLCVFPMISGLGKSKSRLATLLDTIIYTRLHCTQLHYTLRRLTTTKCNYNWYTTSHNTEIVLTDTTLDYGTATLHYNSNNNYNVATLRYTTTHSTPFHRYAIPTTNYNYSYNSRYVTQPFARLHDIPLPFSALHYTHYTARKTSATTVR